MRVLKAVLCLSLIVALATSSTFAIHTKGKHVPQFFMAPEEASVVAHAAVEGEDVAQLASTPRFQAVDSESHVTSNSNSHTEFGSVKMSLAQCSAMVKVSGQGIAPAIVKFDKEDSAATFLFSSTCTFLHVADRCLVIQSITEKKPTANVEDPIYDVVAVKLNPCMEAKDFNWDATTDGCFTDHKCAHWNKEFTLQPKVAGDAAFKTIIRPSIDRHHGQIHRNFLNFNWNFSNLHRKTSCAAGSIKPLINGEEYFPELAKAITRATSMIAIAGWKFNLNVRLVRDGSMGPLSTLRDFLVDALKRNPKLRIAAVLFPGIAGATSETGQVALNFEPFYAQKNADMMIALDPNRVSVYLQPPAMGFSHHGKYWSFDYGKEAFVGGIDLATEPSRFDTKEHLPPDVSDAKNLELRSDWSGDVDLGDPKNKRVKLNPLEQNGGPKNWADVAVHITDPSIAEQYWRVFVLRYLHFQKKGDIYKAPFPTTNPVTYQYLQKSYLTAPEVTASETERLQGNYCQLVSSMAQKNGLPSWYDNADHSIGDAWVKAIKLAKQYIHIEQQYFISRGGMLDMGLNPLGGLTTSQDIQNPILDALVDRVATAIRANKRVAGSDPLRVTMVLPFEADSNAHANMRRTLRFMVNAVRAQLPNLEFSEEGENEITNIFAVFGLRSYNRTGDGRLTTAGVYVHSKVLVVDDERLIVGSANINDRSMLGGRDHEMGIYAVNKESATALRVKMFSHYLGRPASPTDNPNTLQSELLRVGAASDACYKQVFGFIPTQKPEVSKLGAIGAAMKTDVKNLMFGKRFQQIHSQAKNLKEAVNLESAVWNEGFAAKCTPEVLQAKIVSYPYKLWADVFHENLKTLAADTVTNWGAFVETQ